MTDTSAHTGPPPAAATATQAAGSRPPGRVRRAARGVGTRFVRQPGAACAAHEERGIVGRDAAFATELTYGTCRTRGLLDAVITAAAGRPTDNIDPVLLDLLRLGTYQLLRTRVEQHAAVSTTVEQAGIEFDTARAGFVNGVLRTIAGRDEQSWVAELAPSATSDPVGHLAFSHAHPRWIAQASPTRSAPVPVNCRTCSPSTTNAPSCTWPPGPAY